MKFLMPLLLLTTACTTTFKKEGATKTIELQKSKFAYDIWQADSNPKQKRLDLRHLEKNYIGELGALSLKDRHLKVFELAIKTMPKGCETGVSELRDLVISQDPNIDPVDQKKEHPQYLVWDFTCK